MSVIKVIIADDHHLFREGLKRILSLERDILVVGEAATFQEAVHASARMQPDILLLDLKMPDGEAFEPLHQIKQKSPFTKIIVLTAFSEEESVLRAAEAHARGYMLKGISVPILLQAIRKVNRGEVWVDPALPAGASFSRVAHALLQPGPRDESLHGLTKREMEILQLVAEGLSNEEIAKRILISRKTVKTHLANIFDKLQVNNRFKAALSIRTRWKKPGPEKS